MMSELHACISNNCTDAERRRGFGTRCTIYHLGTEATIIALLLHNLDMYSALDRVAVRLII